MSLADRRWLRLGTLVVLYVAQGIPWGFTAVTIPAYLTAHGMTEQAVGLALAGTTLPYAFKWIWGPIIDAVTIPRFGRRRPWIVFAQLMMAATIGAMLAIDDFTTSITLLVQLITLHTVFNALQDVAVDALAVDLLDDNERGTANGLMYGAKYGGGAIGGAGLTAVIAYSSLHTALLVQVVLLLAIMLVPLLVRERDATSAPVVTPRGQVLRALADVLATRSAAVLAVAMLLLTFCAGLLSGRAFALYASLRWDAAQVTQLTGGYAILAGVVGSAAGGLLADKLGARRMALAGAFAMASGWLVFAIFAGQWQHDWFVYTLALWETLAYSIMSVALFALCMQVAYKPAGASQFAGYMAMSNLSTTLGYTAVGWFASVSFRMTYLIAVIIQAAVALLLLFVDGTQTARELPRDQPPPAHGYLVLAGLAFVLGAFTLRSLWKLL